MDLNALRANLEYRKQAGLWKDPTVTGDPQAKKVRGRGGTATSLISEGTAAGGAAIGGAIGSVVPILGTAIGAGIGGLAGGFLGRLGENQVRDERWGVKDAAIEGALSGVFAGGPVRLAKAGKAISKGVAPGVAAAAEKGLAAKAASTAAGEAATVATTRSSAQRGAQGLLGDAWGLKTGAKVGSTRPLTPQSAKELQDFVTKQVGVPRTANADMVAERLVNFRAGVGKSIDDVIKTADRTLDPKEVKALTSSVKQRFGKLAGVDADSAPVANTLMKQLQSNKSVSDLVSFRRSLDDTINFARNSNSADPVAERIAHALRDELDSFTSKLVPGLKDANGQFSKASRALDYVLPNARAPRGINIWNNRIAGGATQRVKAALGQTSLPGFGQAGAATGAITGAAARQALPAAYRGLSGGGQLDSMTATQSPSSPNMMSDNIADQQYAGMNGGSIPGVDNSVDNVDNSQFGNDSQMEALLIDLQQTGGKNFEKIQRFFELANPKRPEDKPLNASQLAQANNANSALADLQVMRQSLQRDPNIAAKASIPGGSLARRVTGSGEFEAARKNIGDVLARLRSGAAITDSEYKRYVALMPSAFDTPDLAESKLQRLESLLVSFANPQSAQPSVEDALLQFSQ